MKFNLPRQEISEEFADFCEKKVKKDEIYIPTTRKNLKKLAKILETIQKDELPDYLVLKKLSNNLGHGIFLHPKAKPILKGDIIAPYSGEVFLFPQSKEYESSYMFCLLSDLKLSKDEQNKWDPKAKFHPNRLYSINLDADKKGNFTRFINHSSRPNVEALFLKIPKNKLSLPPMPFEVFYVAKKTIEPGEQLLVCYEGKEKSYWGSLKIKPFPMTPKTFQLNATLELVSKKPLL